MKSELKFKTSHAKMRGENGYVALFLSRALKILNFYYLGKVITIF